MSKKAQKIMAIFLALIMILSFVAGIIVYFI